jgi:hypothetical protein
VTVDPAGKFAYVTNGGSNNISIYAINQASGALTPVTTVWSPNYPKSLVIDQSGKYAFVACSSSNALSVYSVDPTTGLLSNGMHWFLGLNNPDSIAIDPMGTHIYVANYDANNITVFSLTSTAMLSYQGSVNAILGGTASLWNATEPSPATIKMMGTNNIYGAKYSSFITGITSTNAFNSTATTYDGGSYAGYLGGILTDTALESKLATLYIDPSGNAGFIKGALSGTNYTDISMFEMTGGAYAVKMASSTGLVPANLPSYLYEATATIEFWDLSVQAAY